MKRFIDLRGQDTGARFAWWDTEYDAFERHSGSFAWDTWQEFEADFNGAALIRYKSLCPDWVFTNDD